MFDENANYNSLQAKVETRAWHGLSVLGSYTFSKCIDSGSSQGGSTLLLVPFSRGLCDYDLPQNFSGSFDYQLPFGPRAHAAGRVAGPGAATVRRLGTGGYRYGAIRPTFCAQRVRRSAPTPA